MAGKETTYRHSFKGQQVADLIGVGYSFSSFQQRMMDTVRKSGGWFWIPAILGGLALLAASATIFKSLFASRTPSTIQPLKPIAQRDRGPNLTPSPMFTHSDYLTPSTIRVRGTSIASRPGYLFEFDDRSIDLSTTPPLLPIFKVEDETHIVDAIRLALPFSKVQAEGPYYSLFVVDINVQGEWASAGAILVDKKTSQPAGTEPTTILLHRSNGPWIAEFEGTNRFRLWLQQALEILFRPQDQEYWRFKYDIP